MARILLVEDEENSARALQYFLQDQGHEIHWSARAVDAIAAAEEFRPEILLTDVFLADQLGGIHVAETLSARDPSLEVLVMSGLPEPEVRERAEKLERFRLVLKPLRLAVVARLIDEAVERAG